MENEISRPDGPSGPLPEGLVGPILDHLLNAVILTDEKGRINYVNAAFERITGWGAREALGQRITLLKSGETPESVYQELWKTILSGRTWRGVLKNRRKDGTFYMANNVITPVMNQTSRVIGFLAIQEDITARIAAEDAVRERTMRDPLTGVWNRIGFLDRFESLLREADPHEAIALILMDLDGFALINDTFGHAVGDRVLARVGSILREWVDQCDAAGVVGYLGGDEFALACPVSNASEVYQRARDLVRAIAEGRPLDLPAWPTASIGWVLFPDHGTSSSVLLGRADVAVHVAKERGRNRAHGYRPEDHRQIRSRLRELEAIRAALKEGRFVPHYQPILDLQTHEIHHFEALARMIRPDGTVAGPGDFIETAERFGVIGEIDLAIIRSAMCTLAEWQSRGENVTFSLNLSGHDLADRSMVERIRTAARETGADPGRIIFEITETEAVRDLDRARHFILDLRQNGFRFSVDDFGSGFASFRYLKELPLDYLKIDGAFIRGLEEDDRDQVFVQAIVQLARQFRIITIAEFAESVLTLKLLRAFGVDMAQGYAIGRPAPTPDPTVRVSW